jgi:hypothetical protein
MTKKLQEPARLWSDSRYEWVEKPVAPPKGCSQEEYFEYLGNCHHWKFLFRDTPLGFELKEQKKTQQRISATGSIDRRRLRLESQKVEFVNPLKVFNRDKWICQLCNHPVSKIRDRRFIDIASLDHIIPISKGGEHSYANTQLAHLSCNIRKGNRV